MITICHGCCGWISLTALAVMLRPTQHGVASTHVRSHCINAAYTNKRVDENLDHSKLYRQNWSKKYTLQCRYVMIGFGVSVELQIIKSKSVLYIEEDQGLKRLEHIGSLQPTKSCGSGLARKVCLSMHVSRSKGINLISHFSTCHISTEVS